MRHWVLIGAALGALACGDRSELNTPRLATSLANGGAPSTGSGLGGSGGDRRGIGGGTADAGPSEAADGGRPIAPTPDCTGQNSQCIQTNNGTWVGAAVVTCLGVEFVGPWTLLLERVINGQFVTVQTKAIQEPGFGAVFDDTSGPPAEATYRVCVVDGYGTRCADSFTTYGPVDCKCLPWTCEDSLACNLTLDDGCGQKIVCGECSNGVPCNLETLSCCPPGFESGGLGGCLCAPPGPCPRGLVWDTSVCSCEPPI